MISIFRIILGKVLRLSSRQGKHEHCAQSITRRVCVRATPWVLAVTFATLVAGAAPSLQKGPPPGTLLQGDPSPRALEQESPPADTEPMTRLKPKQKQAILKSNFEKMKRDVEDLNVLAKSLQVEIDKSNENVLSLKVVEKAEKIEKLARKIKEVAKGE